MGLYELNKRFATYGFLLSYIIGGWYIEMGMGETIAIILSSSSLILCIIGVFGVIEHYPYRNRDL